jgi:hypothetical protein
VTDTARRFLEDVLDWYPAQDISDFGKFLGALYEDGAVVPDTLQVSAPETGAPAD